MSNVTTNFTGNSTVEAQEAASLMNFTVRRLEQSLKNAVCEMDEYRRTIVNLEAKIKRLEDWKQSQLEVEREWDANAIATVLGGKLGESHRKVIQREVPLLLDRIKRLEEAGDEIETILLQYASRAELPRTMAFEQANLSRRLCVNWRRAKEAKP